MGEIQGAVLSKDLSQVDEKEFELMGGKASSLAILLQKNFPVPSGFVVFREPQTEGEFASLVGLWKSQGSPPVAARSSASGEDSSDFSYAGQFITVLHIETAKDLAAAIDKCFKAVHLKSSRAYAEHFDQGQIPMHVLVQRMINSQFSGVYFSVDPRIEKSSWLVEVVEGQGEQLVSGQVTPFRFKAGDESAFPKKWKKEYLEQVIYWGQQVEKAFGYKVDMEWAIDHEGQFWILQSRPITALAAPSSQQRNLQQELQRLQKSHPFGAVWDSHTFTEWTGTQTELTHDLWRKTFKKTVPLT